MKKNAYSLVLLFFLLFSACGEDDIWQQAKLNEQLLEAIQMNNPLKVDSLIKAGAQLEIRAVDGATPLLIAAGSGHHEIVKRLIDAGAPVDARREGYYGSTALMETAVDNDTISASYLLDANADINLRDTFGDPAINWGAYYGHVPYVQLLLQRGANWDTKSQHGTALDIATKEWNLELLDFFIKQGAGDAIEAENLALIKAVKKGNTEKVALLLDEGADPNASDQLGMPSLIWAAARAHQKVLELLLSNGADPNLLNRTGQTALAAAARFGHAEIANTLLKAGAKPDLAGDRYRLTALISAAIGGHTDLGTLLLEAGANIDLQDEQTGYTPLMYAVAYGHKDFVQLMIDRKANPYIKGKDDTGLYELIGFSGNEAIAKMLETYILDRQ